MSAGGCVWIGLHGNQAGLAPIKVSSNLNHSALTPHCGFAGRSECPAYPTELVFALDMSEDVTPAVFERQRSALLSLLEDIEIAESNCPTGARVAVVGFSAYTKYLIRFQDYHRKKQLIESVKNIALERTTNRRHLGATMRFVGHNIFKRVRSGVMMRKVAVFLNHGQTEDVSDILTATMEYRGLNIVPVVISLRNTPAISRVLEVGSILQLLIKTKAFLVRSAPTSRIRLVSIHPQQDLIGV